MEISPASQEELRKYRLQWCKVSWRQRNLNFCRRKGRHVKYMQIDGLMISWNEGFGFIVGFIRLFIWFMTMFYVTFFWINIPELDILGWQDPGLRMKPTMVEGPNSPLYISLPRSSIMPQVHGVPVGGLWHVFLLGLGLWNMMYQCVD